MIRTYQEVSKLRTFEERFEYLRLDGEVGRETFGFDRIFNQLFYGSKEWRIARRDVIARDLACDLGIEGYELETDIHIHHMNPISIVDIRTFSDFLLNRDYLICVSLATHNAIHYGGSFKKMWADRSPNDTCPWKRGGTINGKYSHVC